MIIVMAFTIVCLFAMLFTVAEAMRQVYRRLEALEDARPRPMPRRRGSDE
jgi:hypothetical protein